MSELTIERETSCSSMGELRPILDDALAKQFPGGMLQRKWEGDVLHLSGPGALGTIEFAGGKVVGRAQLSPPASMMRGLIEQKITQALEAAVGS
jgi:hypothetical protein